MRTVAVLTCAALTLVGAVSTTASTASNTMPAVTAGTHKLDVTGATAKRNEFTLSADSTSITAARVTFLGDQSLKVVKARFGGNADILCTVGLFDATAGVTNADCTGFLQPVNTSVTFTLTVT